MKSLKHDKEHHNHSKNHNPDIQLRVKKIKGQIGGIEKMIEENRYCIDILTQISAARSALDSLAIKLLEQHSQTCLVEDIKSGKEDEAIKELMGTLKRFLQI